MSDFRLVILSHAFNVLRKPRKQVNLTAVLRVERTLRLAAEEQLEAAHHRIADLTEEALH